MKKFIVRILWLQHSIGLSIDHIVDKGYSPLSSYFFWPSNDVWTQIKIELESKPWISDSDKIDLLNQVTLIINYWQENKNSKSIEEIKKENPDFLFCGDY